MPKSTHGAGWQVVLGTFVGTAAGTGIAHSILTRTLPMASLRRRPTLRRELTYHGTGSGKVTRAQGSYPAPDISSL